MLWGIPYGARAFADIARKDRVRNLDDVISQGIKDDITVFCFYDDKVGQNAKQPTVAKFKQLMDSTNGVSNKNIFWGGPIKILRTGPNGEILKYQERYTQIDDDTYDSLGYPRFLISGKFEGGSSAAETALTNLRSLIQNIRQNICAWYSSRIEKMMEINGDEVDDLQVYMSLSDLNDNATFFAKIKAQRDSGIISSETVADIYDYSVGMQEYQETEEYMKQMEDENYRFGRPAAVPFQGVAGAEQSGPGGAKQNGRPAKADPASVLKSTAQKRLANKTKEKNKVKASIEDIVEIYASSLFADLSLDYVGMEDKIYIPLTTACHIAEAVKQSVENDIIPETVLREAMLEEANKFSLDVQHLIVAGEVEQTEIMNKTNTLKENLTIRVYSLLDRYRKELENAN
jgi:hypothetical protein